MSYEIYRSPLTHRYSSDEMLKLFSMQTRYSKFRLLWLYLAKAQKKLGLNITDEQLDEMQNNIENIDFEKVEEFEIELHHDVMAHLHTFANQCRKAKPIIHLGATSCYLTDNADLIIYKEALFLIKNKLKTFY
ncbi:MAG: Adenylosuccinate lyase [Candidatus Anoxychlamydiales bacterium]|nr:Adenylosuccinate lyase [Candidatus Anoxychlamydiales bacterium]